MQQVYYLSLSSAPNFADLKILCESPTTKELEANYTKCLYFYTEEDAVGMVKAIKQAILDEAHNKSQPVIFLQGKWLEGVFVDSTFHKFNTPLSPSTPKE